MITIVHIDTERTWRGGEGQVLALATKLPKDTFRSIIAAPAKSPLLERAFRAGIPVYRLRGTGEISPVLTWDIYRCVKKFNADILHVHTSHGLIPAAWARWISGGGIKVIYARRTDFKLKTRFLNLSLKKYMWGADRIICVSEAIRQILISGGLPPHRLVTIYSGIDPVAFHPESQRAEMRRKMQVPENVKVVGIVAALAPHKDPLNFVAAAKIVAETFPDAVFWIIGSGRLWEEVKQAVQGSAHPDRISMLGFRTDVPELLAAMDIFCISSLEEGLCTSILDAMAGGLPVVATRVGGIPEAVVDGETGLLVPPGRPQAFADAVLRLLHDPETAKSMGRAGRDRICSQFDISITVEKTASEYLAVMESGWKK